MSSSHHNNGITQTVRALKGVGELRGELLENFGIVTLYDLLTHFPRRYLDRTRIAKIADIEIGKDVTAIGQVIAFRAYQGRYQRFVLVIRDESGELKCIWFRGAHYLKNTFKMGEWLAVHGKVKFYKGMQMSHPDYDRLTESKQGLNTRKIIPLYRSTAELDTAGLDSRAMRRLMWKALEENSASIEENLPERLIKKYKLLSRRAAIDKIHFPDSEDQLNAAIRRLKFEELFYLELMIGLRKLKVKNLTKGIQFESIGEKTRALLANLPFELTDAQKKVIKEIWQDMNSARPMNRLLHGDVGSGKTIVSIAVMLIAVENGYQSALMAPTEILAEQHYLSLKQFLADFGISIELVIGGQKKSEREKITKKIASGEANIIIGTHALFQEKIKFEKLGLIIVDEQHKFGVMQRAKLRRKGINPDVLVMTATPIPRTLALTVYGDLDVSLLDQKPGNRIPIKSVIRYQDKREEIYRYVREQVDLGRQAYIIFPLVEESEKMDLQAATESYETLKYGVYHGLSIALLHGRMKGDEKDKIMSSFKSGYYKILIATTVVEVGVDVANASIMVIEHAERFGLTQLHQLRGRIGRGSEQSYCIFIAHKPLNQLARKRLQTLERTTDGFEIAEVDLKLRGPGEFFGIRQHGMPKLKIADLSEDYNILEIARKEAFSLLQEDSTLNTPKNQMVRLFFDQYYEDSFRLSKVA